MSELKQSPKSNIEPYFTVFKLSKLGRPYEHLLNCNKKKKINQMYFSMELSFLKMSIPFRGTFTKLKNELID